MGIIDRILTRRRAQPRFSTLKPRVRQRFALACRELNEAEQAIASRVGLSRPPRLLMVDEEEAVIVVPEDRAESS